MANIFTSNQVNHVYVATALKTSNGKVAKSDAVGTISVQKDAEGNMYFMHRGQGGLTRSDLITNIMDVRYTPASKMARKKNAALITLNTNAVSSSKAIAGQDYILRLTFQNPIGMSPDHEYWKHAVVHATANMGTSAFYAKMAQSLVGNFSRDAVKLLNVYLTTSGADVEVTSANQSLTGTYTGIKLVEAAQDWVLGVKQDKPIVFKVNESTINNGTSEVYWADVVYSNNHKTTGGEEPTDSIVSSGAPDGGSVVNSHLAAELEYFAMGERADLYRGIGWPDNRITKYIVDPDNAYGYDMINIHYAYVGSNHAIQKSEKDITILVPRTSSDTTAANLGALATSIKGYIDAIVNPVDPRYEPAS